MCKIVHFGLVTAKKWPTLFLFRESVEALSATVILESSLKWHNFFSEVQPSLTERELLLYASFVLITHSILILSRRRFFHYQLPTIFSFHYLKLKKEKRLVVFLTRDKILSYFLMLFQTFLLSNRDLVHFLLQDIFLCKGFLPHKFLFMGKKLLLSIKIVPNII